MRNQKNNVSFILVLTMLFALIMGVTACGSTATNEPPATTGETPTPTTATATVPATTPTLPETDTPTAATVVTETPGTDEMYITLTDGGADVGTSGATVAGGVVTIGKPGVYHISGSTSNGQIVVAVAKEEKVSLVLENASVTNPTGSAIYCDSADKLHIIAADGTVNELKDGKKYANNGDGPNATIYCDDDLTIEGTGTLKVTGLFKNGISSKNDIKIRDLTLTVDAYNTGIRGKGSVTIESGSITIDAGNDGIKATEAEKADKGFVTVTGGTLKIIAGDDGFQAETVLTISGGNITVSAEGKATNAPTENVTPGIIKEV